MPADFYQGIAAREAMSTRKLPPDLAETTWKCCGLGLFQLGLLAGLSVVGSPREFGINPTVWLTSTLAVLGALLAGRTASRAMATVLLAYMLGRLAWEVGEMGSAPVPLQYLKDISDVLITLLAFKATLIVWRLHRREEVRYGRIVTKMLGRVVVERRPQAEPKGSFRL
jgi:hypothetical protein